MEKILYKRLRHSYFDTKLRQYSFASIFSQRKRPVINSVLTVAKYNSCWLTYYNDLNWIDAFVRDLFQIRDFPN